MDGKKCFEICEIKGFVFKFISWDTRNFFDLKF